MNPFQKLRRAVDKATLNYQTVDPTQPNRSEKTPISQAETKTTAPRPYSNDAQQSLTPILIEQQTKYIQEINELSTKNERLARSLKVAEAEKEQYIQQICVLEKNNEALEQKLKELFEDNVSAEEKERKYKQEIYRINKTLQMLGKQLNQEKNAKKNILAQFSRYKQESAVNEGRGVKLLEDWQAKVKCLQEQLKERSSLLEYNILKNSEERKDNRILLERTKNEHDAKVQELLMTVSSLKDELSSLKTNFEVLNLKYSTSLEKYQEVQNNCQELRIENSNLSAQNQKLDVNLRECDRKVHELEGENSKLALALKEERENVRVKVVEIKDESLQLELEMYRRQCKDLLQQRAIWQRMGDRPAYQVLK